MLARQIKDLSIALEALSRMSGYTTYSAQIESLLQSAIYDLQKEYSKPNQPSKNIDDEIPF